MSFMTCLSVARSGKSTGSRESGCPAAGGLWGGLPRAVEDEYLSWGEDAEAGRVAVREDQGQGMRIRMDSGCR